jgi:antitoxin VapB
VGIDLPREGQAIAVSTYTHVFTVTKNWFRIGNQTLSAVVKMQPTKIFRNGNSQAVRVPAELAYERMDIELEIERVGDELRIRPVRRPLTGTLKKFARFGSDFMSEGRGDQEQSEREEL